MRIKCPECRSGIVEHVDTCPDCKGTGSDKIVLGIGGSKGDNCPTCKGRGKLISKSECQECVSGWQYWCDFCGNNIAGSDSNTCATCEEDPIVVELGAPLDYRYLDGKSALAAKVTQANDRGVQLDLGQGFLGWTKPPRDVRYKTGQTIAVRLRNPLTRDSRGKAVQVFPIRTQSRYKIVKKSQQVHELSLQELMSKEGNIGSFTAQVIDNFYMKSAAITLFTLIDASGKKVQGAVPSPDGSKSYSNINSSSVVKIVARYRVVNEKDRLQIFSIDKTKHHDAIEFFEDLSGVNIIDGKSIEETSFHVESSVYDELKVSFASAAKRIRTATLRNQNIIVRYHSPCVDGVSAAYGIDFAIKQFVLSKGTNPNDFRRNIRRIPQRNSVLEVREVVRDLAFAMDDGFNMRNMPLYILVDLGSNEESRAALSICKSYGVDVVIVDSHSLEEENAELVHSCINSSSVNSEYNITTAMLALELAKFISPETDMSKDILQLAVISSLADNVSSVEYEKYLEIVEQNDYDLGRLKNILSAVDYVIFGLRHFDGGEIVRNLLGINTTHEKTTELIESIVPTSKSLLAKSLKIAQAKCDKSELSEGKNFVLLDLEKYAPRFEYPSHSSILNGLHNSIIDEGNGSVITVGVTSDYLILQNSTIGFNFIEFFNQLEVKLPATGITGYGQGSNGSIQYLTGFKDTVLKAIKKLLK